MSRIFWDTNLFVYLFEGAQPWNSQVMALLGKMTDRGDLLVTSTLTLGEVLVKPMKQGNNKLLRQYQAAIPSVATMVSFDEKAAAIYAEVRCDPAIRPPDAIQVSCAASFGVDLFITNDIRLHGRQFRGIQFIVPLDRVPI